jgi:hypothetical protein
MISADHQARNLHQARCEFLVEDYERLRNDSPLCKAGVSAASPFGLPTLPMAAGHAPRTLSETRGFMKAVRGRTCTASPLSLIFRREHDRQNVQGLAQVVRVLVYFVASFCGWESGIIFHVSAWNFQSDPSRPTTDRKVPVMCVGAPPFWPGISALQVPAP